MRILVALGGNALLRRGEAMTAEAQRHNIRSAALALAGIAAGHELILTHGNGPQIGLLALHEAGAGAAFPLDVLGAETEGMIGYMLELELRNALPANTSVASLLSMVEVDTADPAFGAPTKFVGPVYDEAEARALVDKHGWTVRRDGKAWRRVVPSPAPRRIVDTRPIAWLLSRGAIVIAAGGGGIPVSRDPDGQLQGCEAVIDKDLCAALLARELDVDRLVLATDVDAVYQDWGTTQAVAIRRAEPGLLASMAFPAGSMGPKVEAACRFVRTTGKPAVIGALSDLAALVTGEAGTVIAQHGAG